MRIIRQGNTPVGVLDDSYVLHTSDFALKHLYLEWLQRGIPIMSPVASSPGMLMDGTQTVKPSPETAGIVRWALERKGYTVE